VLEIELAGERGHMAISSVQNVLEVEKYVVNVSKIKRDRAIITTERE